MWFILYLLPVAIYLLYKWFTKNFDFFKKQGIAYTEPFSGFSVFFKKQPMIKPFMDNYFKFKDEK